MIALILHGAAARPLCTAAQTLEPRDLVNGNLHQFNDHGAWCWHQYERAFLDAAVNKWVVDSVAGSSGTGGMNRNGAVEAVLYELSSGRATLCPNDPTTVYPSTHFASCNSTDLVSCAIFYEITYASAAMASATLLSRASLQ